MTGSHNGDRRQASLQSTAPSDSPPAPRSFDLGFVSAASDNDPTTVATLAVVGATTIYELSWLVVLLFPMLAAIQTIAASIGVVCRTSLQGAVRQRFGLPWAVLAMVAVVAVNLVTLTADVEAAGASLTLLTGIPYQYFILPFVIAVGWLLIAHRYARIERFLAFLPFLFLAYGASAQLAHADWGEVVHDILVPHFHFNAVFIGAALALTGTTLTSYVYVWESISVAEHRPEFSQLGAVRTDAVLGMLAACVTFLFILVATGATLGKHHVNVQTAADAARALQPLAGPWAAALFGVGLFGSALLAVPIIAGTTAYVVAQTFGWRGSLNAPFGEARRFYAIVVGSLAVAAVFSMLRVSPISLLYWASIAGGLGTPLTLFFAVRIASDRRAMGEHRIHPWLAGIGWIVTVTMLIASAAFLWQSFGHAGG